MNESRLRGDSGRVTNARSTRNPVVQKGDKGSPAFKAGLKKGAWVISVDGEKTRTSVTVYNELFKRFLGESVSIKIGRDPNYKEKEEGEGIERVRKR